MRKLVRSIAIFLITSYIDAVYRYAYMSSRNGLACEPLCVS